MNCATCAHASKPANKMGDNGWLNCALAEKWNYRAAPAACSFDPSRYVARKEPAKVAA